MTNRPSYPRIAGSFTGAGVWLPILFASPIRAATTASRPATTRNAAPQVRYRRLRASPPSSSGRIGESIEIKIGRRRLGATSLERVTADTMSGRGTAGSAVRHGPAGTPRLRLASSSSYERLGELADALPTRARVSEAALPVVLAALHEKLGRPLVCLLPEDADARDAAEAAAWFLGEELVGFMPSRGVRWESGLEPPPHLVGERARALDVLARGGLVCASAHAIAEALPPAEARPEPLALAPGGSSASRDCRRRSRSPATSGSSASTTAGSSPSAAG